MNEFSHGGMTVSPTMIENPVTGEQSYGEPTVIDNSFKEQVHNDLRQSENSIHQNADGNQINVVEFNEADGEFLLSEVGGEANYDKMLAWAGQNLSAEMIDQYDDVMTRADIAETHNYMKQLQALYNEGMEVQADANTFQNHFYRNVCSPENWDTLTKFMNDEFEQDEIDNIYHHLENRNYSEFEALVQQAKSRYEATYNG